MPSALGLENGGAQGPAAAQRWAAAGQRSQSSPLIALE
jgi:hypothetical protein